MANKSPKPLEWIGSSKNDLKRFPFKVVQEMGYALYLAQINQKAGNVKVLKGFGGASALEVVEDHQSGTYRAVYTVKFPGVVYVLHAFQKKSKAGIATPKPDIDPLMGRLKAASDQYKSRNQ